MDYLRTQVMARSSPSASADLSLRFSDLHADHMLNIPSAIINTPTILQQTEA
jgi:hypothetical protein